MSALQSPRGSLGSSAPTAGSHRRRWLAIALGSCLLLSATTAATTAAEEAAAAVSLEQISWLAGHWQGEALGGDAEEIWTAPAGGTMAGLFRLVHGDGTRVVELLLIGEQEGRLGMRFKHFSPDFRAWEEQPLTFDLVQADAREAVFESAVQKQPRRITYRLLDDGALKVTVEGEEEDGSTSSFDLVLRRRGE